MSLLCGAALTMTPEGGVKRVTELLVTAVLVLTLISPFRELDFETYADITARRHEAEAELFSRAGEAEDRLNRLVIQREYASYIMDKAKNLGMELQTMEVEVQWSLDGYWAPYGSRISTQSGAKQREELGRILRDDLGIPYERQQWDGDG